MNRPAEEREPLNAEQLERWHEDRARQANQHPDDSELGRRGITRGDHYRRKNNGIALRTYRAIRRGA